MAETFIPLFSSTVRSSLWSLSGDCLKVFLTLALEAGPDGVVVASIDGLRRITDIPIAELEKHLAVLESPDPYSKDLGRAPEREGRRLERLHNGWRVVNQEWYREEARRQAELFRKRKWWNEKGDAARRGARPTEKETYPERETETQTQTTTDLEPQAAVAVAQSGSPVVLRKVPAGMAIPDDIRQDARILGLTDQQIDERWSELCDGPIGGTRGVLPERLHAYLRKLPGKWKVWVDSDKARQSNTIKPGGAFKPRFGSGPVWEPKSSHEAFSAKYGITPARMAEMARDYNNSGEPEQRGGKKDADDAFLKRLQAEVTKKRKATS